LAVAHREVTHCAKVAWCRGHDLKGYNQGNVVQEIQKGWTFGKRHRMNPECNNDIRDKGRSQEIRGSKQIKDLGARQPQYLRKETTTANGIRVRILGQQSYLGSRGTLEKTLYENSGSKMVVVETSVGYKE
jgi:hypothetical protein